MNYAEQKENLRKIVDSRLESRINNCADTLEMIGASVSSLVPGWTQEILWELLDGMVDKMEYRCLCEGRFPGVPAVYPGHDGWLPMSGKVGTFDSASQEAQSRNGKPESYRKAIVEARIRSTEPWLRPWDKEGE